MHRIKIRKLTALLLALTLAVTVLTAGAFASGWTEDADNKLTALFSEDTVEAYPDLADEVAVVKLYKVAELNSDGTVTPLEAYGEIEGLAGITRESEADAVDAVIALLSAEIADKAPAADYTISVENCSGSISDAENGVYLGLTAEFGSGRYTYTVAPMLVMLPWEVAVVNGEPHFENDVEFVLKVERGNSRGKLVIEKTLEKIKAGDSPTFIFSAVGYLNDELVLDKVVTLNFNAAGTQEYVIEDIPAGTVVTVTEEYSGAGYVLLTDKSVTVTIIADVEPSEEEAADPDYVAPKPATARFTNTCFIPGIIGHSVENIYSYNEGFGYKFERQIYYGVSTVK